LKGPYVEDFFIIGRVSSQVVAESRNVGQKRPLFSVLSMCLEQILL